MISIEASSLQPAVIKPEFTHPSDRESLPPCQGTKGGPPSMHPRWHPPPFSGQGGRLSDRFGAWGPPVPTPLVKKPYPPSRVPLGVPHPVFSSTVSRRRVNLQIRPDWAIDPYPLLFPGWGGISPIVLEPGVPQIHHPARQRCPPPKVPLGAPPSRFPARVYVGD